MNNTFILRIILVTLVYIGVAPLFLDQTNAVIGLGLFFTALTVTISLNLEYSALWATIGNMRTFSLVSFAIGACLLCTNKGDLRFAVTMTTLPVVCIFLSLFLSKHGDSIKKVI